jgi:hypothetical protein
VLDGLHTCPAGKTTVAKLYGQILHDLGLLSKGEVVVKNPSDFLGERMNGHPALWIMQVPCHAVTSCHGCSQQLAGSMRSVQIMNTKADFPCLHVAIAGSVLGESEKQTNAILDATLGCVLVIDEAYGLHSKSKAVDPYKVSEQQLILLCSSACAVPTSAQPNVCCHLKPLSFLHIFPFVVRC